LHRDKIHCVVYALAWFVTSDVTKSQNVNFKYPLFPPAMDLEEAAQEATVVSSPLDYISCSPATP
jgi:hypothetical protein